MDHIQYSQPILANPWLQQETCKKKNKLWNSWVKCYGFTNTVTISQYLEFIIFFIVVLQLENVLMLFKEIISCRNTFHSFFKIKFKPWRVQFEQEGKLEKFSPVWEIPAPTTDTQCSLLQQNTGKEHITYCLSERPKQGLNGKTTCWAGTGIICSIVGLQWVQRERERNKPHLMHWNRTPTSANSWEPFLVSCTHSKCILSIAWEVVLSSSLFNIVRSFYK